MFGINHPDEEEARLKKHDQKPEVAESVPEEVTQIFEELAQTPYFIRIMEELRGYLRGKVVASSGAGHSGYFLRFQDGDWLVCYLDPTQGRMDFRHGSGELPSDLDSLIRSPEIGDGAAPLSIDYLYANEACEIAKEVANSHGKPVRGVGIGQKAFNLCFPEKIELDATVFEQNGKLTLRVFWEQW
jgi:hypothetical protein